MRVVLTSDTRECNWECFIPVDRESPEPDEYEKKFAEAFEKKMGVRFADFASRRVSMCICTKAGDDAHTCHSIMEMYYTVAVMKTITIEFYRKYAHLFHGSGCFFMHRRLMMHSNRGTVSRYLPFPEDELKEAEQVDLQIIDAIDSEWQVNPLSLHSRHPTNYTNTGAKHIGYEQYMEVFGDVFSNLFTISFQEFSEGIHADGFCECDTLSMVMMCSTSRMMRLAAWRVYTERDAFVDPTFYERFFGLFHDAACVYFRPDVSLNLEHRVAGHLCLPQEEPNELENIWFEKTRLDGWCASRRLDNQEDDEMMRRNSYYLYLFKMVLSMQDLKRRPFGVCECNDNTSRCNTQIHAMVAIKRIKNVNEVYIPFDVYRTLSWILEGVLCKNFMSNRFRQLVPPASSHLVFDQERRLINGAIERNDLIVDLIKRKTSPKFMKRRICLHLDAVLDRIGERAVPAHAEFIEEIKAEIRRVHTGIERDERDAFETAFRDAMGSLR